MNYAIVDPMSSEFDRTSSIGYSDYHVEIGRKKRDPKERQARFKSEMAKHEKRTKGAANALAKVDNNPYFNAALGVTAAIVPWGTAAAGIVKVGMVAARAVLAFANSKCGKAIHKGITAVASAFRKDPARKKRRQARKAARKAKRKGNGKDPDKQLFLAGVKSSLATVDMKPMTKVLAKTIVKSNQGDKQAQADLAALQMNTSPAFFDNMKDAAKTAAEKESAKLQKAMLGAAWKNAAKLAAKVEAKVPPNPAAKAKNTAIQKQIRGVAKAAENKVASAVSKPVEGILVKAGVKKAVEGKFRKGKGADGWLVNADTGRITSGLFA